MSLDACFEREESILDGQLESGALTQEEYNDALRELEFEYGDAMRQAGY